MLAGQALLRALIDRHRDKDPLAYLRDKFLRLRDVLQAVPAGDRLHGIDVGVEEALASAQPGDSLGVDVVAPAIGVHDEPATANANVHDLAGEVALHQRDARAGELFPHLRRIQGLILLEVRAAVVHRGARVIAHAKLLRPEQAVGQPNRQSVGHGSKFSCCRNGPARCTDRSRPAERIRFGKGLGCCR
ncbi:hypothetical protein D9M71_326660 [compost metagenome]